MKIEEVLYSINPSFSFPRLANSQKTQKYPSISTTVSTQHCHCHFLSSFQFCKMCSEGKRRKQVREKWRNLIFLFTTTHVIRKLAWNLKPKPCSMFSIIKRLDRMLNHYFHFIYHATCFTWLGCFVKSSIQNNTRIEMKRRRMGKQNPLRNPENPQW